MVVITLDAVYIFELKFDGSAPKMLFVKKDIKNYATSFKLSREKIVKVGVNFSSKTRTISEQGNWLINFLSHSIKIYPTNYKGGLVCAQSKVVSSLKPMLSIDL